MSNGDFSSVFKHLHVLGVAPQKKRLPQYVGLREALPAPRWQQR
jgi:hypothetical protein